MADRQPAWKMTLLVIWAAMVLSVGVYGLLVYLLAQDPSKRPTPPEGLLPIAQIASILFPLLALGAGIAVYRMLARVPRGDGVAGRGDASSAAPSRARIQVGMIIMLAIFESVVIIGLLFFFLGEPPALFARFAVAAVVLDLIGLTRVLPDVARAEGR